jgi:hypothetical protein
MQKADSLRAALTAVLPHLATDPEQLKMFVEEGRIRSPMTGNRGFIYEYTLTLELTEFAGHASIAFLAINDWLARNQPDLLAANAPGYKFEADLLDNTKVDLLVYLKLSENVKLTAREGGGFDLEHLAEPALFPDDEPISEPPALLKQIYWKDELLVQ